MNKKDLLNKIKLLEGLTQEERAELVNLLNTKKKYGLIWENKPEDVEEQLRTKLPVLREVVEKRILSKPSLNQDAKGLKDKQDKSLTLEFDVVTDNSKSESLESFNPSNHSSDNGLLSEVEAPNHILIEGDNLHALTALTFTHENKIDVIYIDPPYNTGNKDFKYNDAFVDKEDSYRHSKWLSFMHKRLEIAKRLMSDKGVIFISIDDNEQAQLKLLCDEVFGNNNFISELIWKKKQGGGNDSTNFVIEHEYVIGYSKSIANILINLDSSHVLDDSLYPFKNDDGIEYGLVTLDKSSIRFSESLVFEINDINGNAYYPRIVKGKQSCWRWGKKKVEDEYDDLVFKNGKVYTKYYRPTGVVPKSILYDTRFGRTESGKDAIKEVLGNAVLFTYPKPVELISHILRLTAQSKSIILDFFAGSGTTLQATMQLNAEDSGNRQCILVTNNENNICEEVTYERNKRVIQGYTNAKGIQVEGLTNNNLRYYRSEYVGREKTHKNKRELVLAATELLCIKEDIYTELTELTGNKLNNKVMRCFSDKGKYMMVIYEEEAIETLLPLINSINSHHKIKIYIFAPGQYPFTEEFEDVLDKVELCALPDAIYKAYANVLPKKKAKPTVVESDEESTETETSESAEPNLFTE